MYWEMLPGRACLLTLYKIWVYYTITMKPFPPRLRLIIASIGILIVACSLVCLAYAYWPMATQQLQATLAPTLFSPP